MYSNTGPNSTPPTTHNDLYCEQPEDDIVVSNSDEPIPYVQAVIVPDDDGQQVSRLQDQWEARILAEQHPEVVVEAVDITADAESNPHIKNTAQSTPCSSSLSLLLRRKSFLVCLLCCIGAAVTGIVCITGRNSDTSVEDRLVYLLEALGPYIVRDGSEYQDLALLEDPTSPQARALSWMAELDEYSDQPEHVETKNLLERYVLAVLYFSTSGPHWTNTFPFMDGVSDVCRWNTRDPASGNGVFCMDSFNYGAITGVALQELGLNGTIPWELSLLTDSTWLYLSGNALTGTIPKELSALTGLGQLWLHSNLLTGTMISSISLPSVLLELNLGGNALSGTLPIGWLRTMTSLTNLQLGGNRLRGTLPSKLASLSLLTTLELSENRFRGTIPTQWSSLGQLTYLGLGGNRLSGTIPQALDSFSSVLEELHLEGNFFTGTIPNEWPVVMTSLTHLGLGSNNLHGTLPSTWEDFEHLLHLDLGKNVLTGQIPTVLGGMSSLRHLSLKENGFTGGVPVELANLPNISVLDISGNFNLSGTLPQEFTNWGSSRTLLVNGTNFTESLETLFCSINSTLPTLYADCLVEEEGTLCSCCTYCCSPALPFYCESNDGNPITGEQANHANFLALMGPHIIQNDFDQYLSHGPSSPQYQALSWMMNVDKFSFNFEELSIETLLERYALAVMYFSMSGWPQDLPFLDETLSVCEWNTYRFSSGVTCKDGDEVVQQIDLDKKLSGGTIPWNEISLLKELTSLGLSQNYLTGTLPPRMNGSSKPAQIFLRENLLTGTLPASLSQYPTSLKNLAVSSNQLEGTIPTTIAGLKRLTSLSLQDNELTGPLPTELGELTRLLWMYVDMNRLSGTLPSELGNLTNLYKLWLSSNRFTGTVPEEFSNLVLLSEVFLWDTSLTGSVDSIFCDWKNPPVLMGADCAGNDPELECSCCNNCHW